MSKKLVAIVPGSSSGIGRATAIRLARDFGAIVLVAKGAHDLEGAAAEVRSAGAEALVVEQDLSLPASADAVVKATLARFGRIDALVNVACAVPGLDVFEMSDEQWDAGLALKFHGARRLTLRAWDALKAAGIARFGEAEDIAELMAFAVSPAARWMTGTVLRMDGGEVKSV